MIVRIPLYAFLLASPPITFGFTGPQLTSSRKSQVLNGVISDLYQDRFEDVHLFKRFKNKVINNARDAGADLKESTSNDEKKNWATKDKGLFRVVPSQEMTGVEPHMTRLCSTLSHQLYTKNATDEIKLSTKNHTVEVLIYDDHGDFNSATVPFSVVVCEDTMILGWRGTGQVFDAINDIAASPQSSLAWRKHAKSIKVQGAFTSIVQNDIVTHERSIIEEAKKRNITEIITTGQSLGGGAAQVAHLILRAQIQDETSPWVDLKGINVRSIAFCGPMTTVLLDNASSETEDFVDELVANSCNMVFSNDIIPRGYGYLSFVEDYIDNVIDSGQLSKKIGVPRILRSLLGVREKLEHLVDDVIGGESVEDLVTVLSRYIHIGNIIYYESEGADPRVLKDMGAFYKNPLNKKDIFRDVKYKSVREPVTDFMSWHMDIINSPGLSYTDDELSK